MSYYSDLAAKAHPSIVEAEFSVRVLRAVVDMWPGISIFGLMEKSDPELLRVPGVGRKGLREIREAAPHRHLNAATRAALDAAAAGKVTRHTVESLMADLNDAKPAAGMVVKVRIDPKLASRVEEFLLARGLTLDQAVGLYLRAMINTSAKSRALRLADNMPFGKYQGERVETILRVQPDYIAYLVVNSTNTRWDPEVLRVLEELTS